MGTNSKVQWCHHTFNGWIGCSHKSPGCENCYAEVETFPRVQRARGLELWGPKAARHVTSDANWRKPLAWNAAAAAAGERHHVFSASESDVFEDRADLIEPRARLWRLIMATPHLDWLLLTKRPENLAHMVPWMAVRGAEPWANVWLGTTVEDQRRADERIPYLLRTPAAVRFLSCEPLLGPLELSDVSRRSDAVSQLGQKSMTGIDWVIVGGESGHGARPFELAWARSIVEQCRAANVPVFVKQMGTWPVPDHRRGDMNGRRMKQYVSGLSQRLCIAFDDKKGGNPAQWPEDLRVREYPRSGATRP